MADLRTTVASGRKAAAKTPAKKAAAAPRKPAGKKATAVATQVDTRSTVTTDERRRMIAEAAYLRAERRGFTGGDPNEDWLSAEAEIDQILSRT